MAQVSLNAQPRTYLEHLEKVLQQGPAGSRSEALAEPSRALLQALQQQPPSDALKLAQGAVVQLQNSWRTWCRQQEEHHGAA